jgi:hypothetical protein
VNVSLIYFLPFSERRMRKTNFCTYRELKRELRKPLKQKVEDTENIIAERLGEFGYKL